MKIFNPIFNKKDFPLNHWKKPKNVRLEMNCVKCKEPSSDLTKHKCNKSYIAKYLENN